MTKAGARARRAKRATAEGESRAPICRLFEASTSTTKAKTVHSAATTSVFLFFSVSFFYCSRARVCSSLLLLRCHKSLRLAHSFQTNCTTMATIATQPRPYRDFLTPALHSRFTEASLYTFGLCYLIAIWMGELDHCKIRWPLCSD